MENIFRLLQQVTLVLSAVVISGCAEFQSSAPPAAESAKHIPVKKAAPMQSAVLPKPTGALTLECAVETALASNPGLSARRHEIRVADAEHSMAYSTLLPKMDLAGSIAFYRDERMIAPRRRGDASVLQFTDQELAGDVIVRMPLFAGGRLINEVKAAKLLYTAAQHNLARNREELIFNVTSVFYSILAQRHTIEALKFSRDTLAEHHKRVEELLQAKKAARVDLLRTEVRLSDLEQREVQESNILAIQNRILANLMGAPHACSESREVKGSLDLIEVSTPEMAQSLDQALNQRADYRAAKVSLDAQRRQIKAAKALRWPTLDLLGSYGTRMDAHDTSEDNEVGMIMLGMNIPVFSGGYISAKIKKEKAAEAAAAERLNQLELQIQLDTETAILNIGSSCKRVRATEKSITQAKESLRIERERYEFGKGSIIDVLEAQSALLNAQMNYYNSLAAYKTAQAQYALAIGEIQ
ncbi:MAG: TolC family protein [Kiritimatiellia bacterium]